MLAAVERREAPADAGQAIVEVGGDADQQPGVGQRAPGRDHVVEQTPVTGAGKVVPEGVEWLSRGVGQIVEYGGHQGLPAAALGGVIRRNFLVGSRPLYFESGRKAG